MTVCTAAPLQASEIVHRCRAIARFEEGIPEADKVTRAILGGPEGHFDLLFPLTNKIMYYASCFPLPEVRSSQ